jgi:excinuclease ABC subunit C
MFEGSSKKIMSELEKERDQASKTERYEEALLLQRRIDALGYITQPFHRPHEYDVNPNLRIDLRQEEMDSLQAILEENGCPVSHLRRIECYDISHIQGTNTVASMVVFVNGEKESSQYRKFKIRLEKTPDDFASMQEVLQRRLKHTEWEMPGLIIVDGGKGQVSSAMEVLEKLGINVPLVGLAKREETLVLPILAKPEFPMSNIKYPISNEPSIRNWKLEIGNLKFTEVSLSRDSSALHLVQRIRDEAHRFAITYHRKLRSKNAIY